MALVTYTEFKLQLAKGGVRWATDDVRAMLVGTGYTLNTAHRTVSDVLEYALDVPRVAVTGRDTVIDYEGGGASMLASNFAFEPATETVGGVVFYVRSGEDDSTPSDDRLIAFCGFDPVDLVNQSFQVELPGQQFLYLTS